MPMDLNEVIIIGRLVKDPEIKYTASGTPITNFTIANNQTVKKEQSITENVNFFDICVWGNYAIYCEKYLKKGNLAALRGSLRQRRWKDKKGQSRSKVEIIASMVQFLNTAHTSVQSDHGKLKTIFEDNKQKEFEYNFDPDSGPWDEEEYEE